MALKIQIAIFRVLTQTAQLQIVFTNLETTGSFTTAVALLMTRVMVLCRF